MKKQILLFILALLPMVAKADKSGTCGDNLTWTYVEATKTLTISGSGAMNNYSFASSRTTGPWNSYYQSLKTVIINSGVTSIGDYAFSGCSSLTSITIPNSVTRIGWDAFFLCSSLTSITIPNSVTIIGGGAFYSCSSLTSITIPNSVTSIENNAFSRCTSLTSVTISNGVTSIGDYAFWLCSSLTFITIPNSVTSIGNNAFDSCSSLTSVTIPNGVTNIGTRAFAECFSLTSVTIPNSVTSIGKIAFAVCTSLTSITIPNSVTSIGESAFAHCTVLADVYCYAETLPDTKSNAFYDSNIKNSTLHVPASAIDEYRTTKPWSEFKTIICDLPSDSYKLIYLVDGEEQSVEIIDVGAAIIAKEEPTKEGYTFSGWSEIPETMPAHDVTVTGSFTINHYTLTLMVGDNVYETKTLDYGSAIVVPEMPELTGYTFTWGEVPATMPAQDVTIIGEYQPKLYNVTYLIDGQFYAIYKVAYGSTITPPEVPELAGNTFTWGEYPEKMPAHDIIIEGTYTDGIDLVQGAQNVEIYTLDGKKVNRMQRGVNIIRRGSKVMKVKR